MCVCVRVYWLLFATGPVAVLVSNELNDTISSASITFRRAAKKGGRGRLESLQNFHAMWRQGSAREPPKQKMLNCPNPCMHFRAVDASEGSIERVKRKRNPIYEIFMSCTGEQHERWLHCRIILTNATAPFWTERHSRVQSGITFPKCCRTEDLFCLLTVVINAPLVDRWQQPDARKCAWECCARVKTLADTVKPVAALVTVSYYSSI